MSYIIFLDMLGARASASIDKNEYKSLINDFNDSLKNLELYLKENSSFYSIYGYSDNAYIEIEELDVMIYGLRFLRKNLMLNHRYFSSAIACGKLDTKLTSFKKHGNIMTFTGADVIDVYKSQSEFSGIGYRLSNEVIKELERIDGKQFFCTSIYQNDIDKLIFYPTFDISYEKTKKIQLSYIISDYISTTVMNSKAGRYYLTPIISMIKCLDDEAIKTELIDIVHLITLQNIPVAFKNNGYNEKYILFFLFAIFEKILSMNRSVNDILEYSNIILDESKFELEELIDELPHVPIQVISDLNKKELLKIIFNKKR